MSKYTTGELAKLCNVSVRTVQYYDLKGLLPPTELSEGGRRLYNDDELRKLQLICTLKAIGLSLNAIKNVLNSGLSGKILTILLDDHAKTLAREISERQKQSEMIKIIKDSVHNKAIIPVNIIIDIEEIMEKKNNIRNQKKLALLYLGVAIAAIAGFSFMLWLVASRIWWGLAVYTSIAIITLLLSAKENVFICPKCDSVFKPSLLRAIFSTGNHKVRWMTCPECGHEDWCVLQKQIKEKR